MTDVPPRLMRRLVLLAAIAAAGLLPVPATAAPLMTWKDATAVNRHFLSKRFGSSFNYGYAYKHRCSRIGHSSFRCRPSWVIGDSSYYGRTKVFFTHQRGDIRYYRVKYAMNRLNEYCVVTGGSRSECTHRFRGVY